MVKRGALNKVEKFYIEGHTDLSVEQIANELDRSINSIQKHLNSLTSTDTKTKKPITQPVKKETQMQQLMGRHERAGKKVATVMTESASALADDQRNKFVSSKKMQEAIHRPLD